VLQKRVFSPLVEKYSTQIAFVEDRVRDKLCEGRPERNGKCLVTEKTELM